MLASISTIEPDELGGQPFGRDDVGSIAFASVVGSDGTANPSSGVLRDRLVAIAVGVVFGTTRLANTDD